MRVKTLHVGSLNRKRILVTLTSDFGKILGGLHEAKVGGTSDFKQAFLVAKLALANRISPIHTQRIIMFVGSPLKMTDEDVQELITICKDYNIALDIISFGEVVDNAHLLEQFPAQLGDDCTLVTIPAGPQVLLDVIAKTNVIMRDGGLQSFDPEFDPEYAAAIRESMGDIQGGYNEEEALAAAIAASLADQQPPNSNHANSTSQDQHKEMTMDEELEMAIRLSMEDMNKQNKKDNDSNNNEKKMEEDDTHSKDK